MIPMTNELTTIDPETIKRQFEQAVARREAEERRLADEEKQLHEMTANPLDNQSWTRKRPNANCE
jgi:multidrug resistance efflux pump